MSTKLICRMRDEANGCGLVEFIVSRVINAAKSNDVAIERNHRCRLPRRQFVKTNPDHQRLWNSPA